MSFDKDMMETLDRASEDLGDKTETAVVGTYQKIEDAVVGGYQKMEDAIVGGFAKMTDKMVEKLFAREGESVEEAKERLIGKDN